MVRSACAGPRPSPNRRRLLVVAGVLGICWRWRPPYGCLGGRLRPRPTAPQRDFDLEREMAVAPRPLHAAACDAHARDVVAAARPSQGVVARGVVEPEHPQHPLAPLDGLLLASVGGAAGQPLSH